MCVDVDFQKVTEKERADEQKPLQLGWHSFRRIIFLAFILCEGFLERFFGVLTLDSAPDTAERRFF